MNKITGKKEERKQKKVIYMEKWKNIYYNRLNPLGIFKLPFHSRDLDHRRFVNLHRQLHLNILLQRETLFLYFLKKDSKM